MPSYDAAYISPTSSTRQACGALHVAFLTLIAAYFLIFPIYRGFFSIEIGPNESWNAYHAPDALIVNNYPPISFYVISWIVSWTGGDALFVGRVSQPLLKRSSRYTRAISAQAGEIERLPGPNRKMLCFQKPLH